MTRTRPPPGVGQGTSTGTFCAARSRWWPRKGHRQQPEGRGREEPTGSAPCHLPPEWGASPAQQGNPGQAVAELKPSSQTRSHEAPHVPPFLLPLPSSGAAAAAGHGATAGHSRARPPDSGSGGCRAPCSAAPPAGKAGAGAGRGRSLPDKALSPRRPTYAPLNQDPGLTPWWLLSAKIKWHSSDPGQKFPC